MMLFRTPQPVSRRHGFTLIELLVVVSIIGFLVALSFPFIRGMLRSSQEQMAANSISNGIQAARAYATRYKPFTDSFQGRTAEDDGDGYSGAALIVTPANELRVVENDERAEYNGRRLELPGFGAVIYNGYRPIEGLDDLLLPRGVSVLGMVRTDTDEITLLPPPFAVAFSRRGELMTQANDPNASSANAEANLGALRRADGFVYFDGDGDGNWETNHSRRWYYTTQNGTLDDYRRGVAEQITIDDFAGGTAAAEADDDEGRGFMEGRLKMPFEKIEPVIGIVVFQTDRVPVKYSIEADDDDTAAINSNGTSAKGKFHPGRVAPIVIDTTDDDNLLRWVAQVGGGEVLFFNRRTGADLRR